MNSAERLRHATTLQKAAMMRGLGRLGSGAMQLGAKAIPKAFNAWRGLGSGTRMGMGALGAGGALYGGYRMLQPNTHGIMPPNGNQGGGNKINTILDTIQSRESNQVSDLNQIYKGFGNGK